MTAPSNDHAGPPIGRPPSRPRFGVGFLAPEETEAPPAIPSPSPSPETMTGPDSRPASAPESAHDERHDESDPAETGSPASATRAGSGKVGNPLVGSALQETFRNGVIIASAQAHGFLANTQGKLEAGLYLADRDDAANIGDPLARFAARREGLGEVSPDTADLLAAMMGLAGYASKQIQRGAIAQKIDARNAAGGGEVQTLPTPEDLA